ncbi:hypothetical protein ZWY2020_004625 [Hordeum vulgare]|nr:hypothetical protein ZWY2020_004625 [Hordeum vulgare]
MGGDDWIKFIADFNLGHGELVVFNASQRMVKAYVCYGNSLSTGNNEEPHEVLVVDEDQGGVGVVREEEVLNDEHMEAGHPDIAYNRNVMLSEAEASRLDVVLTIKNGFIGLPFVHRLAENNVKSKLMEKFEVGEAIGCRFIYNDAGGMNMIVVVDLLNTPVE